LFQKIRTIHLIGIGGSGMNGIAEVLLNRGFLVRGSDLHESDATERLKGLGALIFQGHHADHVGPAEVVVVSSAVPQENPEVQEAHRRNIPVIARAEMLMELMRAKDGIAIAGAHGKTTTTSMVLSVLAAGGLDPTAVSGGRLNALGANAQWGKGDWFIVEADESDGSFLRLAPILSVITNIDREHLIHYGNMEGLRDAFAEFANRVPFYGACIVCLDDPEVQKLLPRCNRRLVTYGLSDEAQVWGHIQKQKDVGIHFQVYFKKNALGSIRLKMPGRHNVQNALAAVAVGLECDVSFAHIKEGLEGFAGIERRFHIRGERKQVLVIDDYAHHPREIQATLLACKENYPERRLVVLFQPHRYSRLQDLFGDFVQAFDLADLI